jgi:hypothetical protein
MTLPASGAISFSNIDTELGFSSTAQISLNCSSVRTLFGVASGAIDMNTGHGKSNGGSVSFTTPGQYTWTVPSGVTSISAIAIGGGRGGSFAPVAQHFGPTYNQCYGALLYNFYWYPSGGGGHGGLAAWRNNISVTPGQTLYISVGDIGQKLNNCWVEQDTYLSKARNTSTYTTYYNSAWSCSVVWSGGYDFYTKNYCSTNPQSQDHGQISTNYDSSKWAVGGTRGSTVRGCAFGTYYGGSGPCGSKTTGGGGGGGPPVLSSGHPGCNPYSNCLNSTSFGHGGTSCTTCASGIPGVRGPIDYGSSSGQSSSNAGGAGGDAGQPGYGSGALFGSAASQGSAGGYGAGGAGANYTGSFTLATCRGGQGALRIVWPGCSRGWPNTNVCSSKP